MAEQVKVPLTRTTWRRDYAGGIELKLLNRFFESDPSSTIDDTALLPGPAPPITAPLGQARIAGTIRNPASLMAIYSRHPEPRCIAGMAQLRQS